MFLAGLFLEFGRFVAAASRFEELQSLARSLVLPMMMRGASGDWCRAALSDSAYVMCGLTDEDGNRGFAGAQGHNRQAVILVLVLFVRLRSFLLS